MASSPARSLLGIAAMLADYFPRELDLATVVAFLFADLTNFGGPITSSSTTLSLMPSDLVSEGERRWKTLLTLGKASIGSLAIGDGIIGREGEGGWRLWGGVVEEGREEDGDYGVKSSRKGGRRRTEIIGMGRELRKEDECYG
uniref:Uncharacterized protein n=1 Tax=Oryza nivara TaxID=4536 RepID=A0A0E0FKT4_ORYNI